MNRHLGRVALMAAIAGSCGYASASTVTVADAASGADVSLEGASVSSTSIDLTTVTVTLGDIYQVGDRIRLTLSGTPGAKFATYGANAPSISCTGGDFIIESPALSSASASAEFAISAKSANVTSIGKVCTFKSLAVLASSIGSTGTVALSSAKTDGVDPSSAVTVMTVVSQIGSVSVLSALNGVVDYQNSLGLGFATDDLGAGSIDGKGDQLTLSVASTADTYLSTTANFSVNFVLAAQSGKSFGFLDDAGSCGTSARTNRTTSSGRIGVSTGSITLNPACTTLTYSGQLGNLTGTARTLSVEFGHKSQTPSTGIVIEPQTFPDISPTVEQGARGTRNAAQTAISPGSWTSNGSTTQIPYMPVNSTAGAGKIDPVIVISNRSTATGVITATLRDEAGNTCSLTESTLGTIAGGSTKSIGGAIRDAVAGSACSTLDGAGGEKLAITLTVTLPSGSTEVYSGYTVGGSSRVTVVNSSNGVPNP